MCAISIISRASKTALLRSATQFGKTLPVAGKVNVRDFYNFLQKAKPRFFVGAVGCALALPFGQSSHARSAPPLPKNLTSLRFSGALLIIELRVRKPRFSVSAPNLPKTFGFMKRGERTRFLIKTRKRQNHAFAFCTLRFTESVKEESEFRALL